MDWRTKLREADLAADKANQKEQASQYDKAFQFYIQAARLYLEVLKIAPAQEAQKAQVKASSAKVLKRAERLKTLRKDLRYTEADVLSQDRQNEVLSLSSTYHGTRLPPYQDSSLPYELYETALYSDPAGLLPLSAAQQDDHGGWKRLRDLAASLVSDRKLRGSDIYQGKLSNCSVVASLAVCVEHNFRFGTSLAISCILSPGGLRKSSSNGAYALCLYHNGCRRTIVIDDYLPVSTNGELQTVRCVDDTAWPALVEKGYFKLRSGYHAAGSNSNLDLFLLTGWLPEEFPLQQGFFPREKVWDRLYQNHREGRCLLTAGTKAELNTFMEANNLVKKHAYAILDMRLRDDYREVLLYNPWPLDNAQGEAEYWVDWEVMCTQFQTIYANWDPQTFSEQPVSVHFSLKSTESVSFQLTLGPSATLETEQEIWLLSWRHAHEKVDQSWLSLSAIPDGGVGEPLHKPVMRSVETYSNSHVRVTRITAKRPQARYLLTISYEGATHETNASIVAYANLPLKITSTASRYTFEAKVKGNWSSSSAGGNHESPSFYQNPQYLLTIASSAGARSAETADISVKLEASRERALHVAVVRSNSRISELDRRNTVADSGPYSHGLASCSAISLSPGKYVLVSSTFAPGEDGAFSITALSSMSVQLSPILAEGSGMYQQKIEAEISAAHPVIFRLQTSSAVSLIARMQYKDSRRRPKTVLSLHKGSGTSDPGRALATSGPPSNAVCGLVLPLCSVAANVHGYSLHPNVRGSMGPDPIGVRLIVYSDVKLKLHVL